MVSKLKERTDGFYCANCYMRFKEPVEICPFCESIMSNWEEVMRKLWSDRNYNEIKEVMENDDDVCL